MALVKRHVVAVVLPILVLATCALGGCVRESPPLPEQVMEAASGPLWYRGNLHAHTLWSDGDDYPEAVVGWYRDRGYHFLALTEHDLVGHGDRWIDLVRTPDRGASATDRRQAEGQDQARLLRIDELAARFDAQGRFLLLPGEEISDAVGPVTVHVNAVNMDQAVAPARAGSVNATIEASIAAAAAAASAPDAFLAQLNHPNFTHSITAEHLMRLEGTRFFEVYNGHPLSSNPGDGLRPSTERLWDIALAWRLDMLGLPPLYATATDDAHHYRVDGAGPGRGWIMVLADALEPAPLARAMQRGRFYASTGVHLQRIVATPERMEIDVAAEPGVDYLIEFIGTRAGFDATASAATSATGRPLYASQRYSDDIGRVLASRRAPRATYRFAEDDLYVRARITASRRHPSPSDALQYEQAWVQPLVGPAGQRPSRSHVVPPQPPPPAMHAGVTRRFQPMDAAETLALTAAPAARCTLELLTDGRGRDATTLARTQHARFAGWLADPAAEDAPDSLAVLLVADTGYIAEGGPGRARPDVAQALGRPAFERAGFDLDFELYNVATGRYGVWLLSFSRGKAAACETGRTLQVE